MSLDKLFSKEIDRRDFLKKTGQAALAVGSGLTLDALLSSCATIMFKEEPPVIYPHIGQPGQNKVQPPAEGCYIGFHPDNFDFYEQVTGKKPKVVIPSWHTFCGPFPSDDIKDISSQGAIGHLFKDIWTDAQAYGLKNLVDNKEFTKDITEYAKDIVKCGKPFFVCTMREMNLSSRSWPWAGQPKVVKEVWKHMWQIFEDNGANQYATWVWEVYCTEDHFKEIDNPEKYYPGDKYVDWIGLSAYSRSIFLSGTRSFSYLVEPTYGQMRTKHPDKPIMMAEFGKTWDKQQPKWIKNAYETIKSWPGMKAAIYWDSMNVELNDNHMLIKESHTVLQELFKDPYFIGAK